MMRGAPDYLTPAEAAQVARVSRQTIWRWMRAGTLPAVKLGRGWRIRRVDLERLLEPPAPSAPPRPSRAPRRRPTRGR